MREFFCRVQKSNAGTGAGQHVACVVRNPQRSVSLTMHIAALFGSISPSVNQTGLVRHRSRRADAKSPLMNPPAACNLLLDNNGIDFLHVGKKARLFCDAYFLFAQCVPVSIPPRNHPLKGPVWHGRRCGAHPVDGPERILPFF